MYKDFTKDVSRTVSNMMEVMQILNKGLLKRGEFKHCVRSCYSLSCSGSATSGAI